MPGPPTGAPSGLRCDDAASLEYLGAYLPSGTDIDEVVSLLTQGLDYQTLDGTTATLPLSGAIDWELAEGVRSEKYHLNSLTFLGPLLGAQQSARNGREPTGSEPTAEELLGFARNAVLDWLERYPYRRNDPTGLQLSNKFAWYDMAVGVRAGIIGYLLRDLRCRDDVDEDARVLLERGAQDHLAYLTTPWLLAKHSNHGFYQALGLAALCQQVPDIEGCPSAILFALQQLSDYVESSYSRSAIHKEHSPFYHQFLTVSLDDFMHNDLGKALALQRPGLRCLVGRATENLYWLTDPRGYLLRFGDTDLTKARLHGRQNPSFLADRSCLRYEPPGISDPKLGDFRDAGLVVYRDGDGSDATMIALQAAFHSRVHKQADDGTFEYFRLGVPVIVDSGKFGYLGTTARGSELRRQGYYYSDPRRIYVESTHAHNTVEIDTRSDNRADRPAYGSAITAAGAQGGFFAVAMQLVREPLVRHERVLLHRADRWLLVVDWLDDLTGRPRDYSQWLQLHPSWSLASNGESGARFSREETDWEVGIYPLGSDRPRMRLVRGAMHGESEPKRREGWLSLKSGLLEPRSAAVISRRGRQEVIATLITTDGAAVLDSRTQRFDAQHQLGLEVAATLDTAGDIRVRIERGSDILRFTVREGGARGAEQSIDVPWERPDSLRASDALLEARATELVENSDSARTRAAYERAAQIGSPDAALFLAKQAIEDRDWPRARDLLLSAAQLGNQQAAISLGRLLARPTTSVTDLAAAVNWLERAGLEGASAAWYQLGELHRDGKSLPRDLVRAADYYRRAAARGHLGAKARLAELLLQAKDSPAD